MMMKKKKNNKEKENKKQKKNIKHKTDFAAAINTHKNVIRFDISVNNRPRTRVQILQSQQHLYCNGDW